MLSVQNRPSFCQNRWNPVCRHQVRATWSVLLASPYAAAARKILVESAVAIKSPNLLDLLLNDELHHFARNPQLSHITEKLSLTIRSLSSQSLAMHLHTAKIHGHPLLTDFLQSEERTYVYQNFQKIADARSLVEHKLPLISSDRIVLKGVARGMGKKSNVLIWKVTCSELRQQSARNQAVQVNKVSMESSNAFENENTENQHSGQSTSQQQVQHVEPTGDLGDRTAGQPIHSVQHDDQPSTIYLHQANSSSAERTLCLPLTIRESTPKSNYCFNRKS